MWSPELSARSLPLAALLLTAALLSACTVRPLYSDAGGLTAATQAAVPDLPAIALAPVTTRQAQEVRNHLFFLLNGGGAQPVNPRYTVTLNVSSVSQSSATIQVATDEEPTAAQILMVSNFVIADAQTGRPLTRGKRQVLSSFDVPRQEFAVRRARIDAENRAARELAELLRLAIAQELIELEKRPVALK